jgi:pilus assembly protein CpaE
VPNHYRLVREAIDRGVPLDEVKAGNPITAQLRKLVLPQVIKPAGAQPGGLMQKLSLAFAK